MKSIFLLKRKLVRYNSQLVPILAIKAIREKPKVKDKTKNILFTEADNPRLVHGVRQAKTFSKMRRDRFTRKKEEGL